MEVALDSKLFIWDTKFLIFSETSQNVKTCYKYTILIYKEYIKKCKGFKKILYFAWLNKGSYTHFKIIITQMATTGHRIDYYIYNINI